MVANQPEGEADKIGAKLISHGRYVAFQMADKVAVTRGVFAEILRNPPVRAAGQLARLRMMGGLSRPLRGEFGNCIGVARFPNQVRHRLCPGSPWEQDTVTSRLMRDAAYAA